MKHVSDLYRENGLEPDLDSYTALLAMYGEAGDMESIMKVSSLSSHTCTCKINWEPFQAMQPCSPTFIVSTPQFTRLCYSTKRKLL